jgi:ribosome-associated protein
MNSQELCKFVVEGMQEKKALDIVTMDLRAVENAISDYFVICTGHSDTQIDAICDSIEETVQKNTNIRPWHLEGKQNREWILLDYVEVIVHIFRTDRRDYYAIEELWADAQSTYVENLT